MSLINLNCPHCGGLFALDSNRPLQTYWTCPYCSNRSLMQLIDGQIRLRGILRVQSDPAGQTAGSGSVPDQPFGSKDRPVAGQEQTITSKEQSNAGKEQSMAGHEQSDGQQKSILYEETAGGIYNPTDATIPHAARIPITPTPVSLRQAVHPPTSLDQNEPVRSVQPTYLEKPVPRTWPDQASTSTPRKVEVPTESSGSVYPPMPGKPRPGSNDRHIPPAWNEKPVAQPWPPPESTSTSQPFHRSLSDYIAEVDAVPTNTASQTAPQTAHQTAHQTAPQTTSRNEHYPLSGRMPQPGQGPGFESVSESDPVIPSLEFDQPLVRPSPDIRSDNMDLQALLDQMERSARTHQLPRFNAISRKISDAVPEDPRAYTWRALLIEEADGFARATWATPWWYLLTPRQKATQIAQHFYTLNTALQYSQTIEREQLVNQIADLLVRQAVDHLTEKAQLRCGKRLFRFRKTFRGRYHKSDLREAADFCDAISRIDSRICPLVYDQLVEAVRKSASFRPKKIARSLSRF